MDIKGTGTIHMQPTRNHFIQRWWLRCSWRVEAPIRILFFAWEGG